MLSQLKTYLLAALGLVSAVFAALFYREKAKEGERAKAAQKVQEKASDALVEGLENEQKVKNEKVDTSKRTDFE